MDADHPRHRYDCAAGSGLPTRRRFLGTTLTVAGASLVGAARAGDAESKLLMPLGTPRSRVVRTRSDEAAVGATVHPTLLREMIASSIMTLTGSDTVQDAWRSILTLDDVIGIKFNRSGAKQIGTSGAMADGLINSLLEAGWSADQIVCIEAAEGVEERYGTTPAAPGYNSEEVDFGSGRDQLAAVLDQVTALINVPFLKTHNIAGITCAMKNLSHGLIKHPARFHRNGCSPYIADIVALPRIQSKLRLCLVDALRVVYNGGPVPTADTVSTEGILLAATDPVAADSVGLATLNEVRRRMDLSPIARSAAEIGHLAAAHRRGVGVALSHGIDLIRRRL